jgi:uncharacterized membrane protein YagU involved in acid resistance
MTSLRRTTIHAGLAGGLVGGVSIWLYEAVVWAGVQKLVPLVNIPKNAVSLAFGHATQVSLGAIAYLFGTAIHFGFAMFWGVVFAILWPIFRQRQIEATLAALVFVPLLWSVMHVAIVALSHEHPDYADPNIVIGGIMSHLFYTVPLALVVKHLTIREIAGYEFERPVSL